jgi:hypothetical protein
MRLGRAAVAIVLFAAVAAPFCTRTPRASASTVCPSRFPGVLQATQVGCRTAQRVVARYAKVAQTRGPRIVVDGFHCDSGTAATEGEVTIVCQRGSEKVTYSGGF